MKRYIFTYQTKNLVSGKTYIGVHTTNKLDDGYIGCGITRQSYALHSSVFHKAVRKYGYDNFKREILCFFDTVEDAYEEETFLVDQKAVDSTDFYNMRLGEDISHFVTNNPSKLAKNRKRQSEYMKLHTPMKNTLSRQRLSDSIKLNWRTDPNRLKKHLERNYKYRYIIEGQGMKTLLKLQVV